MGRTALAVVTLGITEEAVDRRVLDPTHNAVMATFECDNCKHTFRRTYELRAAGKQRRNG